MRGGGERAVDMLGKQGGGGTRTGMGGRVLYSEAPCVVFHCGRESADRRDADRTHPRGHSPGARCRHAFPRPLRTRDPNETRRACQARESGREADPIWRPDPDPRPDRRPPAPAHSPRAVRRARTTRHPPRRRGTHHPQPILWTPGAGALSRSAQDNICRPQSCASACMALVRPPAALGVACLRC